MTIRRMTPHDIDAVIPMRRALFADCPDDEQRAELQVSLAKDGAPGTVGNQACFVAEDEEGMVGFAEVMLRSHAEGCWELTADGRVGVAYLEAWWVAESARLSGVGRALVEACEAWALAQASPVLASDAELANLDSQAAHAALGFEEVERAVHFRKRL